MSDGRSTSGAIGSLLTSVVISGGVMVVLLVWWWLDSVLTDPNSARPAGFANFLGQPAPRAVVAGAGLLATGFLLSAFDGTVGRLLITVALALAVLIVWLVVGVRTARFFGWFDRLLPRSVIITCGGVLAMMWVSNVIVKAVGDWPPPETACEYCENRQQFQIPTLNLEVAADGRKACNAALKKKVQSIFAGGNLVQPLNAWSNFLYAAVGLLAWAARPKNLYACAFAICSCVLAEGSFVFHATLGGGVVQDSDVGGIYGLMFAVIVYGAFRMYGLFESLWRWPTALHWLGALITLWMSVVFIWAKEHLPGSEWMVGILGLVMFVISSICFFKNQERLRSAHEALTFALAPLAFATAVFSLFVEGGGSGSSHAKAGARRGARSRDA
jgi:hypothetical protein